MRNVISDGNEDYHVASSDAILRFWNPTAVAICATVECTLMRIGNVREIAPAEEDTGRRLNHDSRGFELTINAHETKSVRLSGQGADA